MASQADSTAQPAAPKLSPVEGFKDQSRQLRGTIALELAEPADHFTEANKQLLKFHGTYQQEDRDARKNRSKDGVRKHHMFMVRCKMPAGRLTAAQYLAMDDLAGKFANGTLRFTTRQGIQLHGVLKDNLKLTIAGINDCLLTTLGACGDVARNVMACPAPFHDGKRGELQQAADELATHLTPRSLAYHEIWLDGEQIEQSEPVNEPLYGKTYLPRKFKVGFALPDDNCVDVYSQDLGFLAVVESGRVVGYNALIGGGMGMTHGNANTFPHLGQPVCFVPATGAVPFAEAVISLFRDHGNRADRKRARIKYLVHDWGVERFREVLSTYVREPLVAPRTIEVTGCDAHLGWQAQLDGRWFYGISVENGRVKDQGGLKLRTALRTLVEKLQPELRVTPMQDLLFCNLPTSARAVIEQVLTSHGVPLPGLVSGVRSHSLACPAVPTCGLAISESERVLPGLIDQLEAALRRHGLENEVLSVRMTGCPNGCARPYQSDIGLVGRSGDKYSVFVGGRLKGDRLNFMLCDLVPMGQIIPALEPLLNHFKRHRLQPESFGEFCYRLGLEALQSLLPPERLTVKAH
jgi:sulfite reductase (ferredoxin)